MISFNTYNHKYTLGLQLQSIRKYGDLSFFNHCFFGGVLGGLLSLYKKGAFAVTVQPRHGRESAPIKSHKVPSKRKRQLGTYLLYGGLVGGFIYLCRQAFSKPPGKRSDSTVKAMQRDADDARNDIKTIYTQGPFHTL